MTFKEFGTIVKPAETQNKEFKEFGTPVKEISRGRSLISAPIKGAIKGIQEFSQSIPGLLRGPISPKGGEKILEETLPTQEKTSEKILERAGRIAPAMIGAGESLLAKGIRTGVGALAGQTAEELGAPNWFQSLAELTGIGIPSLQKMIPGKPTQKAMLKLLRKRGFSEHEISPFLQSPEKLERFAKFASKGKKTNKLMKDIYSKFEGLYGPIREEGKNLPSLNLHATKNLENEIKEVKSKIPLVFQEEIKNDLKKFEKSPKKFTDLMDFIHDINARIGPRQGGKAVIGKLKEPIQKAMKEISPELSQDFSLAQELYSKRINLKKHLNASALDDLIDMGEAIGVAATIADGNLGKLAKLIGFTGARKLAREILINPRLQNISNRMLESFKKNKIPAAEKTFQIFKNEISKIDPEMEKELP